jgi:hypothetical protein
VYFYFYWRTNAIELIRIKIEPHSMGGDIVKRLGLAGLPLVFLTLGLSAADGGPPTSDERP